MPNNPSRNRGDVRRFVTLPPRNQTSRGLQVKEIIQSSQSPSASNGSASSMGPGQRGSLNPSGGGSGGIFPPI